MCLGPCPVVLHRSLHVTWEKKRGARIDLTTERLPVLSAQALGTAQVKSDGFVITYCTVLSTFLEML